MATASESATTRLALKVPVAMEVEWITNTVLVAANVEDGQRAA
ncbi:MAG TPA: hypothetical protein PK184_00135 [Phycisphaerae bacterium]|nr:hypothetical protein [Phycisphaerae bacterium]HOQ88197.1 hypothetical protein [Phycisphaerae bacterium]HPP29249.1 hypothetical protein [Phycisphaerae bacterium]HPU31086.1 hypothetical protein [Phycisphaerae bacterium]